MAPLGHGTPSSQDTQPSGAASSDHTSQVSSHARLRSRKLVLTHFRSRLLAPTRPRRPPRKWLAAPAARTTTCGVLLADRWHLNKPLSSPPLNTSQPLLKVPLWWLQELVILTFSTHKILCPANPHIFAKVPSHRDRSRANDFPPVVGSLFRKIALTGQIRGSHLAAPSDNLPDLSQGQIDGPTDSMVCSCESREDVSPMLHAMLISYRYFRQHMPPVPLTLCHRRAIKVAS